MTTPDQETVDQRSDEIHRTTPAALIPASEQRSPASAPSARHLPVLHRDAYYGLAGRITDAISPHTEAADAAILFTTLAVAGAMFGRGVYMRAGDAQHPPNIWPLIIGTTAGGRKGTSLRPVLRIAETAYPNFAGNIERGLSSGEGLIERVRDAVGEEDDTDFDPGVKDKRLLVTEEEFGSVLSRSKREGNTLSEVVRSSWDGSQLSTMTRRNSLRATAPHIVIIGHITPSELLSKLQRTDIAGGLMNRFLPVFSHRSKMLPDGGSTPDGIVEMLADEFKASVEINQHAVGEMNRDSEATSLWRSQYAQLTADDVPDGPYASVVARAAAQVSRLSLIYAMLDAATWEDHDDAVIRAGHLRAALAAWRYVQASASGVFPVSNDPATNALAAQLNLAGSEGMTREQVNSRLFSGHKKKEELDVLCEQLLATGLYVARVDKSQPGRPATRYYPVGHAPDDRG